MKPPKKALLTLTLTLGDPLVLTSQELLLELEKQQRYNLTCFSLADLLKVSTIYCQRLISGAQGLILVSPGFCTLDKL